MNEFTKMISGEKHFPEDEHLISLREHSHNLCKQFNSETNKDLRYKLLNKMLAHVGKNCTITPNIFFDYGINTEIGDNVYFNSNCIILDSAKVKIGNNTMLGPNVQLYTPTHPLDFKSRNKGFEYAKPITIGNNCWLGGNVIVLPGVTIGDGCVIGAGAVVTKDITANSLAFGNPAKIIRKIEQ